LKPLPEETKIFRKRNMPSIVNIDRQNYLRALVMLFSPWRDEQANLIKRNCKEFYQGNEEAIKANFDRFNSIESLEDTLRRAMEVEDNNEENIDEEAAVNEEFRALAFPEISFQINVLSLNNTEFSLDTIFSIGVSARSKCSHRQEPLWTPVVQIIKSFQINSSQATTID